MTRIEILQLIAQRPGITRREMQGRGFSRIPHHLSGLLNDGIITCHRSTKGGTHKYQLTTKGHQLMSNKTVESKS